MAKQKTTEQPKEIARVRADNTPTTVKNLAKWLRECLYLAPEEDSKARFSRVVCSQLVKGNKRGEEVFSLDVPKKAGDEWPDNAASEVWGKLQLETATLGGLQKYALYAYHTGDTERHTSRFVLKIQGIDDDESDDLDSEGTGKDGQISQNMRHTEAMAKIVAAMIPTMVSGYNSMIARQSAMLDRMNQTVETLMADKINGLETMRQLSDDAEEREIRLMQARAKAKGVESLVGKLGLLLPAAANKIAGKPIFPVQDQAVMMMLRGLVSSIISSPEKMQAMQKILAPEEQIVFMNLVETVSSKEDMSDAAAPKEGGTEEKG